jgi:N-methylhydantoinase B
VPNQEVLDLIFRNVRKGEMVLGDFQAQLSANQVGVHRLLHFMDEYGLDDLNELAHVIQDLSTPSLSRGPPHSAY